MGGSFEKAGYSGSLKTPSFGDIGSMPAPPDLGSIETKAATNIDTAELHGPWIFLAAPALEGELFVRKDGVVLFRPGNCLGYGIGKLKLSHTVTGSAVAEIELDAYLYDVMSKDPPLEPQRLSFVVAISIASAPSQNYKTFTMHGQAISLGDAGERKNIGAVNAAKLEPWDSAKFGQEWQPNPQIAQGFEILFPKPFALSRMQKGNQHHLASASASASSSSSSSPSSLLMDPKHKVGSIDSVFYIPNYVTEDDEAQCLQQNKDTPDELKNKLDRRVVQEYGGTMCGECQKSFVSDANLPPWCNTICQSLVADKVFSATTFPNNVRIHDYEVGHGIAPHCDGPIYVPRVAILSLQNPVLMSFYNKREPYSDDVMKHYEDTFKFGGEISSQRPLFSLILEPRSLLVFEKDAYHFHPHGISADSVDSLVVDKVGPIANRHLLSPTAQYSKETAKELVRKHRVGVTIRNLLPRCAHEPQRAEYQMIEAAKIARPDWFKGSNSNSTNSSNNSQKKASLTSLDADAERKSSFKSTTTSNYGAMSQAPPLPSSYSSSASPAGSSLSSSSVPLLEKKMDELMQRQSKIESQLQEIQTLLAFSTQRNVKFESDVAGVLDHVSQLVLDVSARVEDIAAAVEQKQN